MISGTYTLLAEKPPFYYCDIDPDGNSFLWPETAFFPETAMTYE